jgi:diamine N-acetyltransferase
VALAERDGRLLGYVLLRDTRAPASVAGDRPLAISRLYVAPDAHRQGIGTALLTSAIRKARAGSHDCLWLSIWEHDPRAFAVYQRWGFVAAGEIAFDLAGVPRTDRLLVLHLGEQIGEASLVATSDDAVASRVVT